MPRYLFIVVRDRPDIYEELRQQFEGNATSLPHSMKESRPCQGRSRRTALRMERALDPVTLLVAQAGHVLFRAHDDVAHGMAAGHAA